MPVTAVSADVGSYLHWAADSKSLHWMVGDRYHSRALNQSFAFLPGAPKRLPKPANGGGIAVGLTVPVDAPRRAGRVHRRAHRHHARCARTRRK